MCCSDETVEGGLGDAGTTVVKLELVVLFKALPADHCVSELTAAAPSTTLLLLGTGDGELGCSTVGVATSAIRGGGHLQPNLGSPDPAQNSHLFGERVRCPRKGTALSTTD